MISPRKLPLIWPTPGALLISIGVSILVLFAAAFHVAAQQIVPPQPDPLARIRAAAGNAQACSVDESSACAQATPKIIASALGASPLDENLRRLTDGIGGRLTGSPEMDSAVAWGVAGFRDAGVDEVHTEKYTIPATWSEGVSHLDVLSPSPFAARLVSDAWSPATPAGGIEGAVVDVGAGDSEDFVRVGDAASGAILLVHSDVLRTADDLFNAEMHDPEVAARALTAGAAAILWMSTRENGLLYRHLTAWDGTLEKLPQAVVAREDALRMARDLAAGKQVHVRLDLPNQVGGMAEAENVVAEIRGREKPDEFVVLAAHLDSWELGTGALDDGCNAALVVEAARDIHLTGLRPRRSIRFVLFSGKEQGMLGSWAYVRGHRGELDKALAAIVFDGGTGRVTGFSLGGRRDIEPGVRESLAPLSSWGVGTNTYEAPLSTDNFDFLLEGVPTLVANQEIGNNLLAAGTASDTYDKVDMIDLKLNTAVAGLLAFSIAEHPNPLGPRLSRPEIESLMNRTGLDAQMRLMDLWHFWSDGQRGRQQ